MTRELLEKGVNDMKAFAWLSQMRFYLDPQFKDPLRQLTIGMANAQYFYGFEYLGVQENLVQTPD